MSGDILKRLEDMGKWCETFVGSYPEALDPLLKDTADEIRALRRQRFSLAAALGYSTEREDLVPIHKALINEVKVLVETRNELNRFRRFMERTC
jgi:hypothetical protein